MVRNEGQIQFYWIWSLRDTIGLFEKKERGILIFWLEEKEKTLIEASCQSCQKRSGQGEVKSWKSVEWSINWHFGTYESIMGFHQIS